MAAAELERFSALPPELLERIFSFLPPDLQSLYVAGHILLTRSRTVSLPASLTVRIFLVGGGGGASVSYLAHYQHSLLISISI